MTINSNYPLARVYLLILSSLRAFLLGLGMSEGLNRYFPHIQLNIYVFLFAGLFIFHWITVTFYPAVNKWSVVLALLANSAYAIICRVFFIDRNMQLTLQEGIWFGSWVTMLFDFVLVALWLYSNGLSSRLKHKII